MKPRTYTAGDYKIVALRELPLPNPICDEPEYCANYWRQHIPSHPYFNPAQECLIVLLLNTRKRVIGHNLVSLGTLDSIQCTAREIFRPAVIASAAAVILMHNHPSGDPTPSEADLKITRDLIRAGQLLHIELLDHVIMGARVRGRRDYCSLRELGYFYST